MRTTKIKLTAESILDIVCGWGSCEAQLAQVKSRGGGNEESKAEQLHGIVGVALRTQRTLDTVNLDVTFIAADKAG